MPQDKTFSYICISFRYISCKGGLNKGQKWYGPNRADVKKRWQEYTEGLYKKIFMTQIITMV